MFSNREQAAEELAKAPALKKLASSPQAVVLGIPRGGIVTGAVLANNLELPLEAIVTRKIAAPGNPEYAIGAVGEFGPAVWNETAMGLFTDRDRKEMEEAARQEAARRNHVYRPGKALGLSGKTAILVDDGLATGMTMLAAVQEAKQQGAKKVIVATPVAPPDTVVRLQKQADEVVALEVPVYFSAVGQFYKEFPQVSDDEVLALLQDKGKAKGNGRE